MRDPVNRVAILIEALTRFPSMHEARVGRMAILSARVEHEIDELFGYVFALPYEHWTIITSQMRQVRRKIDILRNSLRQSVCKLNVETREGFGEALSGIIKFIELRNTMIHGQIRLDSERFNALLDRTESNEVGSDKFLDELDQILGSYICYLRFNPKTEMLERTVLNVSEIEERFSEAESFLIKIRDGKNNVREVVDWISILMPEREISAIRKA